MVVVPAGSYRMGGSLEVEQPQHTVTIAKPFAVSKYELTFADWDACVSGGGCNGYKPDDKGWGRGKQPAMNVHWDDARRYVKWLSVVTGRTYRLLSEAEYEYAARAGTTTAYPWGDDIKLNGTVMANCSDCGSRWHLLPAPVGSFAQNRFGLYDTVGNVWEWVEDCGHMNYNGAPTDDSAWISGSDCGERMARGGSFVMPAKDLHSSYRLRFTPEYRYLDFRLPSGKDASHTLRDSECWQAEATVSRRMVERAISEFVTLSFT
jgi:formylglycine-generating enzyme required for sulfatase activity